MTSPTAGLGRETDVCVVGTAVYHLPTPFRIPLKFGGQVVSDGICARVRVTVRDRAGRQADGWGETPLAVEWSWPSGESHASRLERMGGLCRRLAEAWAANRDFGHPLELGADFLDDRLAPLLAAQNAESAGEAMPRLASLICASPFDIALYDAFANLHGKDVYDCYGSEWLSRDLAAFLSPADGSPVSFAGRVPQEFLDPAPPVKLPAWHLVGGLDALEPKNLTGEEPDDGYPVLLRDWIDRDGLFCLKIKLRGTDCAWDFERTVRVGQIALAQQIRWLSLDFNCTVTNPEYVVEVLDRLRDEYPSIYALVLYVEQPFPYDLEAHRMDVRSVSARKPLFLDESAHDWQMVRLGRDLGWSGVALKTCKTQTGALLSLCWARAHGMPIMVQDLTNPMIAQIPHLRLAAHAATIMGVETNSMQFLPEASRFEAAVHPGLYQRKKGVVDLSTISGTGFGYRLAEIARPLPPPEFETAS